MKVVVKPDGTKWCYHASETVTHRKGWKEGSKGQGEKRMVEDQTFDDICRDLKSSPWHMDLNQQEQTKMVKSGDLPEKLSTKMNLCFNVRDSLFIKC